MQRWMVGFVVAGVIAAGCGGGSSSSKSTTTARNAPVPTTTTTEPTAGTTTTMAVAPPPHHAVTAKAPKYLNGAIAGVGLGALELPAPTAVQRAAGWRDVKDARGVLAMTVPTSWSDSDLTAGVLNGIAVPSIFTAPKLKPFLDGYDTPGAKFLLYGSDLAVGEQQILARRRANANLATVCAASHAATKYDDGLYQGVAELWHDCGSAKAAYLIVVAAPNAAEADFELVLEVQMLTTADVDAAVQAIQTFLFVGSAEDIPGPGATTTPTTATPAPSAADRAIALVHARLSECHMGWGKATATENSGQWTVDIWIVPPGPDSENGDPGTGEYLVDLTTREVTSLNGTAGVLCPG